MIFSMATTRDGRQPEPPPNREQRLRAPPPRRPMSPREPEGGTSGSGASVVEFDLV